MENASYSQNRDPKPKEEPFCFLKARFERLDQECRHSSDECTQVVLHVLLSRHDLTSWRHHERNDGIQLYHHAALPSVSWHALSASLCLQASLLRLLRILLPPGNCACRPEASGTQDLVEPIWTLTGYAELVLRLSGHISDGSDDTMSTVRALALLLRWLGKSGGKVPLQSIGAKTVVILESTWPKPCFPAAPNTDQVAYCPRVTAALCIVTLPRVLISSAVSVGLPLTAKLVRISRA